jgi:hypothetical protein
MSTTTSKIMKLATGALKFLPEAQWVGIAVELLGQLASSMGATSGDSKEALKHIESLRTDLGQLTTAQAQQLTMQAEALALHNSRVDAKLEALSTLLGDTRLATASVEHRLIALETAQRRAGLLLKILCLAGVISVALLVTLIIRQH